MSTVLVGYRSNEQTCPTFVPESLPSPRRATDPAAPRRLSGGRCRGLSPEQISNTLVKEFPHDQEMRVTHETIYRALYIPGGSAPFLQSASLINSLPDGTPAGPALTSLAIWILLPLGIRFWRNQNKEASSKRHRE
jgi:hypothetical protein